MYFFLSIIIKMCLANLIVITPTPSLNNLYPKVQESNETKEITTYSCNELIDLSKSQLSKNLTGLPPGSIRKIRDLRLNKKRINLRQHKTRSTNQANLQNLRQVITTNEVKQHEKKFQFATVNTRSLKPRKDIIFKALNDYQIDLLVTTETWLRDTEDDQQWILGSELNRNGFQTLPINRKIKKGGGLALTIKNNIKVKEEESTNFNSFEHAVWNVSHKNIPNFTIVAIYHPPSNCQEFSDTTFIDQLMDLLTSLLSKYNNIIILGNINMHMEDPTNLNACILQDLIKAFNLSQHVKIPTCNKGHTLDVLITTNSTGFNNVGELVPGPYILDHRLLILETTINKLEPQTITTEGRKPTKNINNIFKEKFNEKEVLKSTSLDDAINHFTIEVLKALDDIAPLKKVKTTNRKPKPWFDEDLKQQRTIMKNRECKWMKYHEDHLWKAFVRERNRYNTMLKFKKNACLHKIIKTNSNYTRNYTN